MIRLRLFHRLTLPPLFVSFIFRLSCQAFTSFPFRLREISTESADLRGEIGWRNNPPSGGDDDAFRCRQQLRGHSKHLRLIAAQPPSGSFAYERNKLKGQSAVIHGDQVNGAVVRLSVARRCEVASPVVERAAHLLRCSLPFRDVSERPTLPRGPKLSIVRQLENGGGGGQGNASGASALTASIELATRR